MTPCLVMMSALMSMRSWVWLDPGDLVNVVLMNSAVRSEKSFGRSAMTSPLSPSEMSIDGECLHRARQPRDRGGALVIARGSQHHDAGGARFRPEGRRRA